MVFWNQGNAVFGMFSAKFQPPGPPPPVSTMSCRGPHRGTQLRAPSDHPPLELRRKWCASASSSVFTAWGRGRGSCYLARSEAAGPWLEPPQATTRDAGNSGIAVSVRVSETGCSGPPCLEVSFRPSLYPRQCCAGKCLTIPDRPPRSLKGYWEEVCAVSSHPVGPSTPVVPGT